ncbi:MAG TPA: adenylate/guanylate cyclase domain-containing protein [Gaiellaceae bacterium]|nr:adenylate/guanylate cyclase domain-containing protein [Gaiellaceae bacterium]
MSRPAAWISFVTLPIAGLVLLLAAPSLDLHWEHHPSHFWLVVAAGVVTFGLGLLLAEAAARRGDARVLLVALAFLATSGFLALHALATPGVLLAGSNAGFQIASPVGLLLAGVFAAGSALDLGAERSRALVRRRHVLYLGLALLMGVWALLSLATLPPLEDPVTPEGARDPFIALALVGVVLYGYAAVRYGRLYRRRRAPLLLAIVTAYVLLAEAMFAVALGRNWHLTWWEWHLLMLVAFALAARAAWTEWKAEGSTAEIFRDLYEERTLGHREHLSVLFADLQGYTSFAERTPEPDVRAMLNEYFAAVVPAIEANGGAVVQTVGDAVMAVFREAGHEERAARAGLAFQAAAETVARRRPEWPRFRVGVNSGHAHVGIVEAPGARTFTPTGDTVNVGARLEGKARAGEVVIGEATCTALGSRAEVDDLGDLPVKGKERPVRAYVLRALAPDGHEGDQRLDDQDAEPERQ